MTTNKDLNQNNDVLKIDKWVLFFLGLLLFGFVFIAYSIFRMNNPDAFKMAAEELNLSVGAVNTIVLLASSATMAMALSAARIGRFKTSQLYTAFSIILTSFFIINKYYEWGEKIELKLYPGSVYILGLSAGEILYFYLYFTIVSLHSLFVIIGLGLMFTMLNKLQNNKPGETKIGFIENAGLYVHFWTIVWILIYIMFYLTT